MPRLSRTRGPIFCLAIALMIYWLAGDVFGMVAEGDGLVAPSPVVADPAPSQRPSADRESLAEQDLIAPAPVLQDPSESEFDSSESEFGFQPSTQPDEPERYEIEPPLPKVTGPRELLSIRGIDESYLNQFIDGLPVEEGERETLLRVLYQLRKFERIDLDRWKRTELNLPEALEDPAAHRGLLFQLWGRATKVEAWHPVAEMVGPLGFDTYYRCEITLDEGQQPAVIFTRRIPKAWREDGPADARASAVGMLLKFASEDKQHPVPVFIAPRIAWYPDTPLGRLGMDVGLLDSVRNREGLTGHDREAFYQMLAAVWQAKPGALLRDAGRQLQDVDQNLVRTDEQRRRHYSVVPLFNKPDTQRGRLVMLSGVARRVLQVQVTDEDIVERFKIKHYYEIYIYPEDSQDNPVVFCVRELPKGMPTGDGPDYSEYMEVAGFFFKTWAYRSRERTSATIASITKGPVKILADGTKGAVTLLTIEGGALKGLRVGNRVKVAGTGAYDAYHEVLDITKGGLVVTDVPYTQDVTRSGMTVSGWTRYQLAPLLIGRGPSWHKPGPVIGNRMIQAIAGGLFVVTLLGIWFALWCYGRGDKVFHQRTLANRFVPAGNVSLNEIGLQDAGGPDFSGLEKMEHEAAELRKKEPEAQDQPQK